MNNVVYLFFDTEFTSLKKDADLISLGIVTEDGKQFYAELNDFDKDKCSSFTKEEVLSKLKYLDKMPKNTFLKTDPFDYNVLGNKTLVKRSFLEWLKKLPKGKKVFVADVLAWDWTLLVDLIAEYNNDSPELPKDVHYIPIDISTVLQQKGLDPDIDRSEFCGKTSQNSHNALEDAKIAMKCWQKLHKSEA